ncbi:MAG: 16S rRNA (cytidine(1402)-2'-O)-methyltransferase [Verrucomicrobiota bacterium]
MHDSASQSGWLALVATPIGNLEDMTFRAVRMLGEADCIAAEDTRRAAKLCAHFDIRTPRTAYHAHNEHRRTQSLLDRVEGGEKIAILSDAGTPAVSDPGFLIVREALKRGIQPQVIPGVSALTFAIVAAGLPVDTFHFGGFLPPKSGKRQTALAGMREIGGTWFLFESPHRIGRLLEEIVRVVGGTTRVALIREATKLHEECIRGVAEDLLARYADTSFRGEFVVGMRPADND